MKQAPLKIAIVDDHALYILGLRTAIESGNYEPYQSVEIQSFNSGLQLYEALEQAYMPDMVFLDIIMPDCSGITVAKRLKMSHPQLKIVMVSADMTEENILQLINIGVNGYISKLAIAAHIIKAVQDVNSGHDYFGQELSKTIYQIYQQRKHGGKSVALHPYLKQKNTLSDREIEIIQHLGNGCTSKHIALTLNISPNTVENHRKNIMNKLGFHNIVQLVKYAIKKGIISL